MTPIRFLVELHQVEWSGSFYALVFPHGKTKAVLLTGQHRNKGKALEECKEFFRGVALSSKREVRVKVRGLFKDGNPIVHFERVKA